MVQSADRQPYKARYFAVMLLLLAISALLSVARSARMMSLTFTGNIWAFALAFRIQDPGWRRRGSLLEPARRPHHHPGTCGLTYRLSHYLITLAGAGFILFIGQDRLIPSAMPEQLVGLLVSVALAIGIAYNHANSQWRLRTFRLKERYRILAETMNSPGSPTAASSCNSWTRRGARADGKPGISSCSTSTTSRRSTTGTAIRWR